MTSPSSETLDSADEQLSTFYNLTNRADEAREELLQRLLSPELIAEAHELHMLRLSAIAHLTAEEREKFYDFIPLAPIHEERPLLATERLQDTQLALDNYAMQTVGTLQGFSLLKVGQREIILSKKEQRADNIFAYTFALEVHAGELVGTPAAACMTDASSDLRPEPETLDIQEVLEHARRYTGFLEMLNELGIPDLERYLGV